MPKILVHTPFNLLLSPTGDKQRFEVGAYDVSEEVASHWYTAMHADSIGAEPEAPARKPRKKAADAVEAPAADEPAAEVVAEPEAPSEEPAAEAEALAEEVPAPEPDAA